MNRWTGKPRTLLGELSPQREGRMAGKEVTSVNAKFEDLLKSHPESPPGGGLLPTTS